MWYAIVAVVSFLAGGLSLAGFLLWLADKPTDARRRHTLEPIGH